MNDLLRTAWESFLLDTLAWTGVMIALVLLVRRPVARYFGAGAAYALWLVPLVRLVLPPITLPAWLAPEAALPATRSQYSGIEAAVTEHAMLDATAPVTSNPVDITTVLILVWLAGAGLFLARRFQLYFALRRSVLEGAVPVGEIGSIRIVETPAMDGPIAFGVLDRVIALPVGFMAQTEQTARDLAIAHELAHHRGGDLMVNMLVQPLFALHWFNPLGWLGWSALRRDQEAACDARVIARRSREDRATYAAVIADFARRPDAAPRAALAAPMACPVLGDKSIIHRLRSLTMSDLSPRRRLAARVSIACAFVAIPVTASIGYAEAVTAAEEVPAEVAAPVAPEPPTPPAPPASAEFSEIDGSEEDARQSIVQVDRTVDDDGRVREVRRVFRVEGKDSDDHDRLTREFDRLHEDLARNEELRAALAEHGGRLDDPEFEKKVQQKIAVMERRLSENGSIQRQIRIAARAAENAPEVVVTCRNDARKVVTKTRLPDGRERLYVCETAGETLARDAIVKARDAIASDRHMSAEARASALAALDGELAAIDTP